MIVGCVVCIPLVEIGGRAGVEATTVPWARPTEGYAFLGTSDSRHDVSVDRAVIRNAKEK